MSDELMNTMNRVKRNESPLVGINLTKKKPDAPKEDKPLWANTQLRKGGPAARIDKKEGAKPDWSARSSLKKAERRSESDVDAGKHNWRDQLKKSSPRSPGPDKVTDGVQEPEWKKISLRATPKRVEDDAD